MLCNSNVMVWFSTSSERVFLSSLPMPYKPLTVDSALNEQFSFQASVRLSNYSRPQTFTAELDVPTGWTGRVRRVGHVPVRHLNTGMENVGEEDWDGLGKIPGYVPDALFDDPTNVIPAYETHTYWFTVTPGPEAVPGTYPLKVRLIQKDGKVFRMHVRVVLHNVRLTPRRDFNITHWFYADSLIEWYKLKPFEKKFWDICSAYFRDYAAHGLDTVYVPAFTPPLDGVKRPTQLIKVTTTNNGWQLDWSDVKKWIACAQEAGITHFEWVHPFTQWGVKYAIRIYEGQGEDERLLWPPDTPACSTLYRSFLTVYLNELHDFLTENKLLDKSFFHVSDEPHGDEYRANYQAARSLLLELAPWMKTMDALSEIEYGRQHLTDMPVPSISTALQYYNEGITSWCYYCCGPRGKYLNRLLDTPLAKIAMHGFLFYRWPFKGFLHWGYNYWFRSQTRELIDVYETQDGYQWPGWAYGDTCQVYPGPDGPVDSIRWEVFAESLQDYQLLQTLNIKRDNPLFKQIKNFENFPKKPSWRQRARKVLFKMADSI